MAAQSLDVLTLHSSDAADVSALLRAYINAEQMRAFNRLLMRRLVILALTWVAVGRGVIALNWNVLFIGVAPIAAAAVWGLIVERNATHTLRELLTSSVSRR